MQKLPSVHGSYCHGRKKDWPLECLESLSNWGPHLDSTRARRRNSFSMDIIVLLTFAFDVKPSLEEITSQVDSSITNRVGWSIMFSLLMRLDHVNHICVYTFSINLLLDFHVLLFLSAILLREHGDSLTEKFFASW